MRTNQNPTPLSDMHTSILIDVPTPNCCLKLPCKANKFPTVYRLPVANSWLTGTNRCCCAQWCDSHVSIKFFHVDPEN